MYVRRDGKLLKTKIVATLGAPRAGIFDPRGKYRKKFRDPDDFWNSFLGWYFKDSMYMVDIFRLNMAFFKAPGRNELRIIRWLRKNSRRVGNVALLGDLPGPKLRLHDVTSLKLVKEKRLKLLFLSRDARRGPSVCIHNQVLGDVDTNVADTIQRFLSGGTPLIVSIGDGNVILRVAGISGDALECIVEKGGPIEEQQGVTFRGLTLDLPSFGDADKQALNFLLDEGIDWKEDPTVPACSRSFLAFVGVSFVKSKQDILDVKKYLERRIVGKLRQRMPGLSRKKLMKEARLLSPALIAKIETKQGWDNIDEILDVADGAMVARGDLALQVGPQEVPGIQKELIRLCNLRGKPVITATEMLASMETNPQPTRAEANDVCNAILDGSDAVMLSAETSKGKYPFQAVRMMVEIAEAAERHLENFGRRSRIDPSELRQLREQSFEQLLIGSEAIIKEITQRLEREFKAATVKRDNWLADLYLEKWTRSLKQGITDRISVSACMLSNSSDDYKAILALSTSGRTVRMISRFRPDIKIIGIAHDERNRRKLTVCFGVYPLNCGKVCKTGCQGFRGPGDAFVESSRLARKIGYVTKKDTVIFIAGAPLFTPGKTNLIQIKEVE